MGEQSPVGSATEPKKTFRLSILGESREGIVKETLPYPSVREKCGEEQPKENGANY